MKTTLLIASIHACLWIPVAAEDSWIKIAGVKRGDFLLLVLEETQFAQKTGIGMWLPLATFQITQDGDVEWTLSSLKHENSRMQIQISLATSHVSSNIQSVRYEWHNAGGTPVKKTSDFLDATKSWYLIPQHFASDPAVEFIKLCVIHESSLEVLKTKTSISQGAVFWGWNHLNVSKL